MTTVREMIANEVGSQNRRLANRRAQMITDLQNSRSASSLELGRLARQEKTTKLWTNALTMIVKNDGLERPATIVELLQAIEERVHDELIAYTVRQSTDLGAVWLDTMEQEARVEFYREIVGMLAMARRDERN